MRCSLPAALWLAAALPLHAMAQSDAPKPPPCQGSEHRQFDFWLGSWEVFTPDGKKAGDNRIEAIDGGCALIERWQGRGGFSGTSLNSWDAASQQWRQHWVDNQGGLLQLAGAREGSAMVLHGREAPASGSGVEVRQRISWVPQPDGSVRQHWQRSDDAGATWSTVFDGRYVRAGAP
jgi:hypothetical protein